MLYDVSNSRELDVNLANIARNMTNPSTNLRNSKFIPDKEVTKVVGPVLQKNRSENIIIHSFACRFNTNQELHIVDKKDRIFNYQQTELLEYNF